MARKSARAAAVQMVFENMLGGDGGEETLRGLIEFTPEADDQEYIDSLLAGVEDKREWIGEALNRLIPARPPVSAREPRHGANRAPRRAEPEVEVTPIPEEYHYEEPQE